MATEIITSFLQITDSDLAIVPGAEVSVYDAGTTTLRNIFSDTALAVAAANPILCDSDGTHAMRYTAAGSYKIVIRRTGAGAVVRERDNIDGRIPIGSGALAIANGGTGATSAGAALTALGGATAAQVASLAADVAALSGTLASSEKTHIATGTTAQRPATPVDGDIRKNTTTGLYEVYTGAAWQAIATTVSDTDVSATDTQEGLIEIATQAEQETATDVVRAVTPGRQHFHPGAAKAWAKFLANGTVSASYNVTGVAQNSTGDWTVTIATDFSTANYAILITVLDGTAGDEFFCHVVTQAAGTFTIKAEDVTGADADPDAIFFACFGDQA